MSEKYYNFLKEWSKDRNITSFFGSDKRAFLKDWERSKTSNIKPRPEVAELAGMGGEDINRAGERFKKPIPIESIKKEVANLAPISEKKQEEIKKFTAVVGSKEFNDTIEDAIKDMYYDQLGGLFPREKIYKDKFLTLPKKKTGTNKSNG